LRKFTQKTLAWFTLGLILIMSGIPVFAADTASSSTRNTVSPIDSVVAKLIQDNVITQDTGNKIKAYAKTQEARRKAEFESLKNMTNEERQKKLNELKRENFWAQLIKEGIITKSVADKAVAYMPKISSSWQSDQSTTTQSTSSKGVPQIKVYINGIEKSFSPTPLNINGSVLVPMRGFFEALGCEVQWNASTKTAIGKKNGTEIKITIDKKTAYVNSEVKTLASEARIINNSTYIPLRFVGEALGSNVNWENGVIKITNK
jgi:hypothetical protein